MLDFEVQKFTRRCAGSQRELRPGEPFFSVLIPEGGQVVRQDYSADAWHGPPPQALGWWKAVVPDPRSQRMHWAPSDVMLHYFQQLVDDSQKCDVCYLLALLMIRRRIFKLEATERDIEGREVLIVFCPRNETEYRLIAQRPGESQVAAIQQELAALLLAGGPPHHPRTDP